MLFRLTSARHRIRHENDTRRRSVGGSPARASGLRPASAALLGNTSNVEFGIRRSVLSRRRSIAHAAAGADADATARAQLLLEVDGVELHGAVRCALPDCRRGARLGAQQEDGHSGRQAAWTQIQ